MNNETNKWAVSTCPESSEVIQRMAFTFGYAWPGGCKEVSYVNAYYLVFDPTDLLIQYVSDNDWVEKNCCKVVRYYIDVLKLFKNPPKNEIPKSVKKLALVEFTYDSARTGMRTRHVLAEYLGLDYVKGYDVDDDYKFKSFSTEYVRSALVVKDMVDYQPK